VKDGKCTKDGKLAGSVLTMDGAIRNATKFSDWSLREAVRAATFNPAQAAGLRSQGKLAVGAEANVVALDSNGEVRRTMVRGRGF
jgi:N-acetylglucosamine-6-phosphate deacetylase